MRMVTGALLVVASAICAAGYAVAQAISEFTGGALLFLAWALGLIGVAMIAHAWFEETREPKK